PILSDFTDYQSDGRKYRVLSLQEDGDRYKVGFQEKGVDPLEVSIVSAAPAVQDGTIVTAEENTTISLTANVSGGLLMTGRDYQFRWSSQVSNPTDPQVTISAAPMTLTVEVRDGRDNLATARAEVRVMPSMETTQTLTLNLAQAGA